MLKILIPILVVVIILAFLLTQSYVVAAPNQAYIISSLKSKPRILVGKAGLKIPFFEKLSKLDLSNSQVDIKTTDSVPTAEFIDIFVDSVATFKISSDPDLLRVASESLLGKSKEEIEELVAQTLLGTTREVIGMLELKQLVTDKQMVAQKIMDNAKPELEKLGVEITNFNIQTFRDENSVIKNLGIDNSERIRKDAQIAKANAQRDIDIAEAEARKTSNDAKVASELEIAKKNNDLAIKIADLKKMEDTKRAEADAAYKIQEEQQRKDIEIQSQNANIAKQEKEAEYAAKTVEVEQKRFEAEIQKKADADKYAAEKKAEADKYAAQAKADADRYIAEQEAAGIRAKGEAEAEAIRLKAEAMKEYGDAAVLQMCLNVLPEMVRNAAEPLKNVSDITMYGDGNASRLVEDVMKSSNQVFAGLKENGIDVPALIAGFVNKKGTAPSKTE